MLRPPPGFALTNPSFPYPTFFRSKLIVPSFRGKHLRRPAGREAARAGIPAPDRTAGSSRQIDLGPMDVIGDTPPPCPADPAISPLHRRSRLVACTCRGLAVRLFFLVALLVLPVMSGLGTAPAFAQGDAPQGIAESAVPDEIGRAHV